MAIRSCKLKKDWQFNGHKKKDKITNNSPQNTTQRNQDWATPTSLKTGGVLRFSGRVNSYQRMVESWDIATDIPNMFNTSHHDEHLSSSPRPGKLCSDQYIFFSFYLELYKNWFYNLLRTSKLKFSFRGLWHNLKTKLTFPYKIVMFFWCHFWIIMW